MHSLFDTFNFVQHAANFIAACRPFKAPIKALFAAWTAEDIQAQLAQGVQPEFIKVPHTMGPLRNLVVDWRFQAHGHLEELAAHGLITEAYKNAGNIGIQLCLLSTQCLI